MAVLKISLKMPGLLGSTRDGRRHAGAGRWRYRGRDEPSAKIVKAGPRRGTADRGRATPISPTPRCRNSTHHPCSLRRAKFGVTSTSSDTGCRGHAHRRRADHRGTSDSLVPAHIRGARRYRRISCTPFCESSYKSDAERTSRRRRTPRNKRRWTAHAGQRPTLACCDNRSTAASPGYAAVNLSRPILAIVKTGHQWISR